MQKEKIKKQCKKYGVLLFAIAGTILLSATSCQTTALEQRGFPLLAYVTGDGTICYPCPPNKVLDTNHIKVLMIPKSILCEKEQYDELMGKLWETQEIPRSALVCTVEDAKIQQGDIAKLEGQELEELLLTRSKEKGDALVTVGELMNEWYNKVLSYEIMQIP